MKPRNPLLKSPEKKPVQDAPVPSSLVALDGNPVAPLLSDEDAYCWVFHPSYGFYFIEGTTNNHYRFFKGDGVGTSNTEVIPNKLYDDCNRGYAFADRNKEYVQIQTAKMVKDYLDFVPQKVINGFKGAFPGFEVYLKGCHTAARKKALDATLETMDQEKHPDQSYTTQNGKMMGKGTEVEQGLLSDAIPGSLLASAPETGGWSYKPTMLNTPDREHLISDKGVHHLVNPTEEEILTTLSEREPYQISPNPRHTYASKKIAANYPDEGFKPSKSLEKVIKWIWTLKTGAVLFREETPTGEYCLHEDMIDANRLRYDQTVKGYAYIRSKSVDISCRGTNAPEELDEAVDDVVEELRHLYPILDSYAITVDSGAYNGLYSSSPRKVEKPQQEEVDWSLYASAKCASCESGDCLTHIGGGTINDLTNSVVTPKPPVEAVIEDANFFKESEDDFELVRTASGIVVVAQSDVDEAEQEEQEELTQEELGRLKQADIKSYGMGTPNGGTTPPAPQPPQQQMVDQPQQPQQPPQSNVNSIPPTQSMNKTPEQLHQDAQNNPAQAGNLTQQQLQQVLQALTASAQESETKRFAEQIRLAAIPIKDSPSFLPPRDDLRRHIDTTEQDAAMEGVHDPTPSTEPAPTTQAAPQAQAPSPAAAPPTAQQELMRQTLSSDKKAWVDEDDDDDDDGPDGAYGTMYGKPLGEDDSGNTSPKARLEYLRSQLQAENISQGELNELMGLVDYIEPGDVELLEAAGVPEFPEEEESIDNTMYCDGCQEPEAKQDTGQFRHRPGCKHTGQRWNDSMARWEPDSKPIKPKRFRPTNKDKDLAKSMGISLAKLASDLKGISNEELSSQIDYLYALADCDDSGISEAERKQALADVQPYIHELKSRVESRKN